MSTMAKTTQPRRPRREFDDEFKAGAVRLVLDEGQSVGRVARELDLTESAFRNWVRQAQADRTKGRTGLTGVEREELRRLRKENRRLRVERDVLKKAAAFFARGERVRFAVHPGGEGHRTGRLTCVRFSTSLGVAFMPGHVGRRRPTRAGTASCAC